MAVPPIRHAVEVAAGQAEAFAAFARLSAWWPLATHSLGLRGAISCELEPRAGGRIFERTAEGLETLWGTLSGWQPPERLRGSWHPGRHPSLAQLLEVRFTAAQGVTRVELEHSGWETAGERAGDLRVRYQQGWPPVLARYAAYASTGIVPPGGIANALNFHG